MVGKKLKNSFFCLILVFTSCKLSSDFTGEYLYNNKYSNMKIRLMPDGSYIASFKNHERIGESDGKWYVYNDLYLILNSNKKKVNNFEITRIDDLKNDFFTIISVDEEGSSIKSADYTLFTKDNDTVVFYPDKDGKIYVKKEDEFDAIKIEHIGFKVVNYKFDKGLENLKFKLDPIIVEDLFYWFFENDTLKINNKLLIYKDLIMKKVKK